MDFPDVSDVDIVGDQGFVTSGSILGHEFYEQLFFSRDNSGLSRKSKIEKAHKEASKKEISMTGSKYFVPWDKRPMFGTRSLMSSGVNYTKISYNAQLFSVSDISAGILPLYKSVSFTVFNGNLIPSPLTLLRK